MTSFYEFVKGKELSPERRLLAPTEEIGKPVALPAIGFAVSAGIGAVIGKSNAGNEFSNQVAALVTSDDFLRKLSAMIHEPMPFEAEDAFVDRCSRAMRGLLDQYLDGKDRNEKVINPSRK